MDWCKEATASAMEAETVACTAAWIEELKSSDSWLMAGKSVGEDGACLGEEAWASLTIASAAGLGHLLDLEAAAFEVMPSASDVVTLQQEPLMRLLVLLRLAPRL